MIYHDYYFRLQGRANPLHTTDAAHCWQRRTEASLRHRTEGLWTNRCNLAVCTIHTWRRSTTVEPVIYCSDRSKGRQAVDHRKFLPSNCNCDYRTTPFPSGARAWTSSRRCFDGRKNDQTGLPAHRSRRATCSVLPILGDPGAVSRVDKMFVVKVYCKIDLTVNFHHEHFIDPTNCPWVSEDEFYPARTGLWWSFVLSPKYRHHEGNQQEFEFHYLCSRCNQRKSKKRTIVHIRFSIKNFLSSSAWIVIRPF